MKIHYSSQYPTGYWAAETGSAEWITAPGAVFTNGGGTTSPNVNAGGDGLYGYGSDSSPLAFSSTHAVLYVYTTTFTIGGNAATGTAVTGLTLSLKLSADNNFDVFVNPANTGTFLATSTAKYVSGANAYTATSAINLTSGFVIGVNTISIEVQNADAAGAGNINYSGLLFYSAGFTGVVPEVGSWLPLAAAVLLHGLFRLGWIRSPVAGRRRPAGTTS